MKINRKFIHEKFQGHCAYCGQEITIKEMQIDHISPKYLGGDDDLKNLNPACKACNFYKQTFTVEQFKEQLTSITNRLNTTKFIYRLAKKYKLIDEKINPKIKFYYENYL